MGAIFKLEHANIMAYLTSRSSGAPRVVKHDLSEFLDVFIYEPQRYLIPERGFEPWPKEISEIARRAKSRLSEGRKINPIRNIHLDDRQPPDDRRPPDGRQPPDSRQPPDDQLYARHLLSGQFVDGILGELRSEFSYYPIYALAVGKDERLRNKAEELAHMRFYGNLLVLIPEQSESDRSFNVIDPIPAFSVGLHAAAEWPGFVFWTLNGESAFCKLSLVDELAHELRQGIREGPWRRHHPFPEYGYPGQLDSILRKWKSSQKSTSRRLLHLSDLHFGTQYATENQPLLDAELRDVVKSVDRVVITGDLFDTPDKKHATLFKTFRNSITYLSGGTEPIAITGNHDQRLFGLFGDDYEQIAQIGPSKIEVDDKSQMIFICFNSSEGGILARGQISSSQFKS